MLDSRSMRLSISTFLLVLTAGLVTGCGSTQPAALTTPPATTADATEASATEAMGPRVDRTAVSMLERPLPQPLEVPNTFLRAIDQGTRTNTGLPGPGYWQQETDYVLTARLDPEAKRLIGQAKITYTNNAPVRLPALVLELAQNLHKGSAVRLETVEVTGGIEIDRVAVEGAEIRVTDAPQQQPGYLVDGTLLAIVLEQPLAVGASLTFEVDWQFTIPQAGAGERMGYSEDNLFFLAYWYPHMAVFDDVIGWYADPFRAQGEFYHGFGTFDLTVQVPEGWLVLATGELLNPDEVLAPAVAARMRQAYASDAPMQVVGPDDFDAVTTAGTDGLLSYRFRAEQVRDVAFSATTASIWDAARTPVGDLDGDGVTDYTAINTLYRESAPRWAQATDYQQHAITFLSEYTGFPYPWPHMTALEGGGIIGGGMEFPMMTIMGDYNSRTDEDLYNVTAHELAHMWIPMIVSTNERRFSWIDEGSTTFAENQARMDRFPGVNHNLPDQQNYLFIAQAEREGELMRWSDFHYDPTAFGIASYSKPATLLVALRAVLGEATFNEAYQAFIATWAYKHPYPYDLFNTFERVSGQDLDWFWHSWYATTWTHDHAVSSVERGDGVVTVAVEDRGQAILPALLTLTLENGETMNARIEADAWTSGATTAQVTIQTPAPVTRVELDPAQAFPDLDRSNNVWTQGDS
ncbi:MAG: M1 family metallopeptidase [Bacteroidota bacterium]